MQTFLFGFCRDTRVFERSAERRHDHTDRRRTPRGGRRASDLVRTGVFAALCVLMSSFALAQARVQFGVDAPSVGRARDLGMRVAYASTWAGAWNQKWGWNGIEEDLWRAKAAGAVPVVQWWYWGDDISPSCVEHGCTDRYHGVKKDKATWSRMSNELADLIVAVGGTDARALVVIETEFNKNGIENYEPFDGYLAEQAAIFHQRGLEVVVGFGNWGRSHWKTFDRAVAAADLLGTMALQSSVRDASTYLSGADQLIGAAQYLQRTFAKRTFVDFAFSSYTEPSYELYQDAVIQEIFRRMDEFRAAGVEAMVWRMLSDDPAFDTTNYHGMAERYWGLLRADGTRKRAFISFVTGTVTEAEALLPPSALPTLALSPSAVNLAAANDGGSLLFTAAAQTLTMTQDGAGTVSWTAAASQPWVTLTPAAGTGPGTIAVSLNNTAGTLPWIGTDSATITVTATAVANHPTANVGLTMLTTAQLTPPTGMIDTPQAGPGTFSGSLAITGWVIDDLGTTRVRTYRDPVAGEGSRLVFIGDAVFVTGARTDIAAANPSKPQRDQAGWGYLMLTTVLPNQGNGTFRLSVYADDVEGHTTLLGTRTINLANPRRIRSARSTRRHRAARSRDRRTSISAGRWRGSRQGGRSRPTARRSSSTSIRRRSARSTRTTTRAPTFRRCFPATRTRTGRSA